MPLLVLTRPPFCLVLGSERFADLLAALIDDEAVGIVLDLQCVVGLLIVAHRRLLRVARLSPPRAGRRGAWARWGPPELPCRDQCRCSVFCGCSRAVASALSIFTRNRPLLH